MGTVKVHNAHVQQSLETMHSLYIILFYNVGLLCVCVKCMSTVHVYSVCVACVCIVRVCIVHVYIICLECVQCRHCVRPLAIVQKGH